MHEQAEIHSSIFTEVKPKKLLATQKNVNVTAKTSHKKVRTQKQTSILKLNIILLQSVD